MSKARGRSLGAIIAVLVVIIVILALQSFTANRRTEVVTLEGDSGGDGDGDIRLDTGSQSFIVRGSLGVPLSPGRAVALDLELHNPLDDGILVREIEVAVDAVDAPNATESLPCSIADFGVRPWVPILGGDGLTVDSNETATLSELDEPASRWPFVEMLHTTSNQDGCKGASLSLSYRATAGVAG